MENKECNKQYSCKHVEKLQSQKSTLGMILIGVLCGFGAVISSGRNVPVDYVAPSKIEIQCEESDKNGNGQLDKIINVDGKPYLIMQSENGKPSLENYKENIKKWR